jgi:hypothetical protein
MRGAGEKWKERVVEIEWEMKMKTEIEMGKWRAKRWSVEQIVGRLRRIPLPQTAGDKRRRRPRRR